MTSSNQSIFGAQVSRFMGRSGSWHHTSHTTGLCGKDESEEDLYKDGSCEGKGESDEAYMQAILFLGHN